MARKNVRDAVPGVLGLGGCPVRQIADLGGKVKDRGEWRPQKELREKLVMVDNQPFKVRVQ
jgi:hypothetical protein